MKTLRRPPVFTLRDVTQVAFEYGRIFQLPHDVLYDFGMIIQLTEDWMTVPVVSVKRQIRNSWNQTLTFVSSFRLPIKEEIEYVTVALLNEFQEVVGFRDVRVMAEAGDDLRRITYNLNVNFDCEMIKQYV